MGGRACWGVVKGSPRRPSAPWGGREPRIGAVSPSTSLSLSPRPAPCCRPSPRAETRSGGSAEVSWLHGPTHSPWCAAAVPERRSTGARPGRSVLTAGVPLRPPPSERMEESTTDGACTFGDALGPDWLQAGYLRVPATQERTQPSLWPPSRALHTHLTSHERGSTGSPRITPPEPDRRPGGLMKASQRPVAHGRPFLLTPAITPFLLGPVRAGGRFGTSRRWTLGFQWSVHRVSVPRLTKRLGGSTHEGPFPSVGPGALSCSEPGHPLAKEVGGTRMARKGFRDFLQISLSPLKRTHLHFAKFPMLPGACCSPNPAGLRFVVFPS